MGLLYKKTIIIGVLSVLTLLPITAKIVWAANKSLPPFPAGAAATTSAGNVGANKNQNITLKQLGAGTPLHLDGTVEGQALWFGIREEDTVEKARLRLHYTASPSLIPELSHIRVMLNEEVIGVINLPKEKSGIEQVQDINIDPSFLTSSNKLRFQLVGHYKTDCGDPLHTSVWTTISNQSEIQLSISSNLLPNDLAILPVPFLDLRTNQKLTLPFYLPSQDQNLIHAADVVASWFGAKAGYRRARFPVLTDTLPTQHAVLFLTNDKIPPSLGISAVDKPTIQLVAHPENPQIKLLVLLGKTPKEVDTAAMALAMGQAALSGPVATVQSIDLPEERKPYDSPNWVATDHEVRIGDLVRDPAELQVKGRNPLPIRIHARLPPDLLIWERDTVKLDIKIRYTPPISNGNSVFTVSVNDNLVRAVNLESKYDSDQHGLKVKLLSGNADASERIRIPSFQLGSDNWIDLKYYYGDFAREWCLSDGLDSYQASVDADSRLDFTGHYHYAVLPNLGDFLNSGFPFTRIADLAETVLVLPEKPRPADIETALSIMGQMGNSSGMPALRHEVLLGDDTDGLKDKDIIIIGTSETHPLAKAWADRKPATFSADGRSFGYDYALLDAFHFTDLESFGGNIKSLGRSHFLATGSLAAVTGFQSPLSSGRSVVSFEASDDKAVSSALDSLENDGRIRFARGDVVILRNEVVESYDLGSHYFRGDLPLLLKIGFHLSRHPVLTALLGLIAGLAVALMLYAAIQRRRLKRLNEA